MVDSTSVKLIIGVPTSGIIRHAPFVDYFNQLEKPSGCLVSFSHGASPAKSRNMIIESALENNCTHIFFLDDDMAPKNDTLMNLLKHDKDIVSGLYLMRNYPHFPVAFDQVFPDGKNKHMFLENEMRGLIEVTNCGFGCVLIKTNVFRKMEKPWVTLGELEKDGWCDDISFFNRARQSGFKIYCDLESNVGHMTQTIVWPTRTNDTWYTTYNTGSLDAVQVPQTVPPPISRMELLVGSD